MYLAFYGFKEKPFSRAPDPRFLYLTAAHREALARLIYAVHERQGFLTLTGEVGTGKTILLRALMDRMAPETAIALVFNPALSFDEFLEYLLADLEIACASPSRAQRLIKLNTFLLDQHRAGRTTVVIVDEAHDLDSSFLELTRLLSNFETSSEKLLQILLVGQPELEDRLARADLRQLRQRISVRASIARMSASETREYIRFRLQVAGATSEVFTSGAITRIVERSGGVPRMVNLIADHSLLMGYAAQRRPVDRPMVDEAIQSWSEPAAVAPPPRGWWRRYSPAKVAAALGLRLSAPL